MSAGRNKPISDTVKAAVIAALLDGQAVSQVAVEFKVSQATASRLKKAIPQHRLNEVETKKGTDLAEMIAANLEVSFHARQNILRQTENADWLNKQSAAELATLYGVTADKDFRVLEAIENAQNTENELDA